MKSLKHLFSTLLTVTCLNVFTSSAMAENPVVPCWQPHDFSFTSSAKPANPFMVSFSAKVTNPDGKTFGLPGFFDGHGIWKIRVAPTVEGAWSLTTTSDLPALNGKTTAFTCAKNSNPKIHGVLRVDSEHPHHFIYDDGTRFFMQAYEYDWLWALDMGNPAVPIVGKSLDLLARHGFNYIILNTYAHDTKWRKGKTGPDDYGPPQMYPWNGSNEQPDHSRMNLAFWQHYDRVMAAMLERGIQAHLFTKVYNKEVNWPEKNNAAERQYYRWLIARYAAYPNVVWDFSKEAHKENDLAYKQGILSYIQETDPYHHLLTVHDDDAANDSGAYDELTDFRTDQHHGNSTKGIKNSNRIGTNHEKILIQRQRRAWPVANVESDYECGPGGIKDKTFGGAATPEATIRTLWDIAMAGGHTAYYYTYTAWDVVRPLDEPKGYTYMKHFGDFWRSTEYWLLQPSDELVSTGWCLANQGKEYVVYLDSPEPFTLEIKQAPSPLNAEWFNPLTGDVSTAGAIGKGSKKIEPPDSWGNAPIVLHLKSK